MSRSVTGSMTVVHPFLTVANVRDVTTTAGGATTGFRVGRLRVLRREAVVVGAPRHCGRRARGGGWRAGTTLGASAAATIAATAHARERCGIVNEHCIFRRVTV